MFKGEVSMTRHHIASHNIISYDTMSYHVPPQNITSHRNILRHVMSYDMTRYVTRSLRRDRTGWVPR